jgi:uncharacterized 2Fe-2S/4Fe-4S cluster protein (DUF4445 family)
VAVSVAPNGGAGVYVEAEAGELLGDVIKRSQAAFSMPCGGRHTCGKCAVLVKGSFSPISGEEEKLLSSWTESAPDGYQRRMACLCRVNGEGEARLPHFYQAWQACQVDGGALKRLEHLKYEGDEANSLGRAMDIGTTSISAVLFGFEKGEALAAAHEVNRQAVYGADVLSRIAHSMRHGPDGPHKCITDQLNGMVSALLQRSGAADGDVSRVVAAGNTTMLHFLTGLDPRGIGTAPFTPQSLFGESRPAGDIFPAPALRNAELYLPPGVSAYVGADITCGMLATELARAGERRLLVDVGTNGEMALFSGGRITCCATAAGPAFEGAQISMGMAALPGAVYKIVPRNGALHCLTIGGGRPTGICGTGLVSAVNLMLKMGALDGGGAIMTEHDLAGLVEPVDGQPAFWLGGSGVYLTQKDIRSIQLAKASIAAGIETLLSQAGQGKLAVGGVDALFLSGGFGSSMDPKEASGIGLFPPSMLEKAKAAGNTSLEGAALVLFSPSARARLTDLVSISSEISLSASQFFMEEYVKQMRFHG